MESESYARLVKCPVLFLDATNNQHGGAVRATDAPTMLIVDFSHGIDGWVTRSPATDPVPPVPSLLRTINEARGLPGLTVTRAIPILTHRVGDPWRAWL